jgi:hypothetical protein
MKTKTILGCKCVLNEDDEHYMQKNVLLLEAILLMLILFLGLLHCVVVDDVADVSVVHAVC